jgi:hypothetical protein
MASSLSLLTRLSQLDLRFGNLADLGFLAGLFLVSEQAGRIDQHHIVADIVKADGVGGFLPVGRE